MRRGALALVVLLAALFVVGCGARPSSTPIAANNDWIAALLGGRSSLALVVRPSALMTDRYWGPAMQRAMAKPSKHEDPDDVPSHQMGAVFSSRQVELFISIRDYDRAERLPKEKIGSDTLGYVYVIRGMSVVDPLLLTTRRGERVWSPPVRLASGVLEYPPAPSYAQRHRGLAPWLFITPDGTWIGVDHFTAGRAHGIYANDRRPPPEMKFDGDGLIGGFVDASVLDLAARRNQAKDDVWQRGLTGGGLVLYGGRDGAVELLLDYRTDGDAERVERYMGSQLKDACKRSELTCAVVKVLIRDVKIATDDTRVGARFFLSELLLEKISDLD
jgi:hypothetical protein